MVNMMLTNEPEQPKYDGTLPPVTMKKIIVDTPEKNRDAVV